MIGRRDLELLVTGVLLIPPLAGLTFLLSTAVAEHGLIVLSFFDVRFFVAALPFIYLVTVVPTVISVLANAVPARWIASEGGRLLVAVPAGAIPFAVCLQWLAVDNEAGAFDGVAMAAVCAAGAFASVVCVALVETFGSARRTPD